MSNGHIEGFVGIGATGTYQFRQGPTINISPNSSGGYTVTYEFWVFYAGENAYKVYVNGVEAFPDAGFRYGSATWVLDPVQYDCINGGCIPKTTYNTPGFYSSLEECETACGTGCSGKCISNSEWAAIEDLANQLKQRNCS